MKNMISIFSTVAITVAAALFFSLPTAALAGGYGMAGCGLGSIVMGEDGGQLSAATTNGTSGSQTFGITLGTSNCTDAGDATASLDQQVFIKNNYAQVSKDAARGGGEYLSALATVMGCESTVVTQFVEVVRAHHSEIFAPQANARQTLNNLKRKANENTVLRNSCARI